MHFKNHEKIALVKILSDLVKADGIVHQNEINYLKFIYNKFDIKPAIINSADHITLEEALNTFKQVDNIKKLALVRMLQQLSSADDDLAQEELLLIASIMMAIDLTMKNLTVPTASIISIPKFSLKVDSSHVLYIEDKYDDALNSKIEEEFEEITDTLDQRGYEFIYVPSITHMMTNKKELFYETMQYIEPSLSIEDLDKINERLDMLSTPFFAQEIFLNYLNRSSTNSIKPGLLFKIKKQVGSAYSDFLLLELQSDKSVVTQIEEMFNIIQQVITLIPKLLPAKDRKALDELNRENIQLVVSNADQLSYNGFYKIILDTILKYNKGNDISRLYISERGDFLLLDKNETEVSMPCLCKALYILFLLHEEGIALDNLKSYREELFSIYKEISTFKDDDKLWDTVKTVTDYTGSTLNANLAKIKKAFKDQLGEHANLYQITGERKEPKRIHIDRKYIEFENKEVFENIIHSIQ